LKILEYKTIAEKEKDVLKQKINEIETRNRDAESKRGVLMLDYEKDKAKWSLEKDHFLSKVSDFQETVEKIEKKNETLLRENEKLKIDKNNIKRSSSNLRNPNPNTSMMNTSILGGKIDNNTSTFISNKDISQYNQPRLFNNNPTSSTNPYGKEMNKILGELDTVNTSKILNEKSFERYDSSKYDKYDTSYNKFKYAIRSSNSVIPKPKEEENGNGNSEAEK